MIHTVFDAAVIDVELNIVLEGPDGDHPHLNRLGVLGIARHYLITMIKNYRDGDLLNHIIWANDEEE